MILNMLYMPYYTSIVFMRKQLAILTILLCVVSKGYSQLHSNDPYKLAGYQYIAHFFNKDVVKKNKIKSVSCIDSIFITQKQFKGTQLNLVVSYDSSSKPIRLICGDDEWFEDGMYRSNTTYTYTYDSLNRIIILRDIETVRSDTNKREIRFVYNENKQIVAVTNFYHHKRVIDYKAKPIAYDESEIVHTSFLEYDQNGNVILQINGQSQTSITIRHDTLFPHKPYDSLLVAPISDFDVITKDSLGNIIERIYYISKDAHFTPTKENSYPALKRQWQYNDKNMPIKIITLSLNNKVYNTTEIKYNDQNLPIKEIFIKGKDKIVSTYVYEYYE